MPKLLLTGLFALAAVLMVLVLTGPKVTIDTAIKPVSLPDDLDAYLSDKEQDFLLTAPDVAKKIVWFNPTVKKKTKLSIVYLHGYSATLMETHPLTENIANSLTANVFYTRLAGHGETKEEFAKATANSWLQDTIEAWEIGKAIGEKVIIIGTSTGATLATWLVMTQQVSELQALIFISPNYHPAESSARLLLWPWGIKLLEVATGNAFHPWEPLNEDQGIYWMTSPALSSSAHLMALVDHVDSFDLSKLQKPVLIFYSQLDTVVSVPKIKEKYALIGSGVKKLVPVQNENNPSKHVLAGDIVGHTTTTFVEETTLSFLKENKLIP